MAKPDYAEYKAELIDALGFPNEYTKAESLYNFNMRAALQGASGSEAFLAVIDELKSLHHEYFTENPNLLFYPQDAPNDIILLYKPFDSALSKIYRRNVYYNKKYPDPPQGGFLQAKELYTTLDDLLRSRLICKYMDGPQFVISKLTDLCKKKGIPNHFRELSTEAGYYAWHFYFKVPVEISVDGEVKNELMWIEIQFTTQLAELISTLTHDLYQDRREGRTPESGWKWKPSSLEFRSSYIGHGLHLLEGIIQSFRDDVLRPKAPPVKDNVPAQGEGKE